MEWIKINRNSGAMKEMQGKRNPVTSFPINQNRSGAHVSCENRIIIIIISQEIKML